MKTCHKYTVTQSVAKQCFHFVSFLSSAFIKGWSPNHTIQKIIPHVKLSQTTTHPRCAELKTFGYPKYFLKRYITELFARH